MTIERSDEKLAEKYKGYAYMYAEYPNKGFWSANIGENELKEALRQLNSYKPAEPGLLYVHFPFCQSICFYCSCTKLLSRDETRKNRHLGFINREIEMLGNFFAEKGIDPRIKQVHLGGGSPSDIYEEGFRELVKNIGLITDVKSLGEFAIEIDPRRVDKDRMLFYHSHGINRISFGVQELNPEVQKAINRVQSKELIQRLMTRDLRSRFQGYSFDVLYGLPKQTRQGFAKTVEDIIELSPERVVLLSFNYSPELHKNQRAIKTEDLPSSAEKEDMFFDSVEKMIDAGYVRVGLEHLVKPSDILAKTWVSGNLNWDMGGYHIGRANKIIGVGMSSASRITDDFYFQNNPDVDEYEKCISNGKFPVFKGYRLTKDDKIRRAVTVGLRSMLHLKFQDIKEEYGVEFQEYFGEEMKRIKEFVDDGIIEINEGGIQVTEKGMPFVSFVCMNFDKYHKKN